MKAMDELKTASDIFTYAIVEQQGVTNYSLSSYKPETAKIIVSIARLQVEVKILHELEKLNSKNE